MLGHNGHISACDLNQIVLHLWTVVKLSWMWMVASLFVSSCGCSMVGVFNLVAYLSIRVFIVSFFWNRPCYYWEQVCLWVKKT